MLPDQVWKGHGVEFENPLFGLCELARSARLDAHAQIGWV